MVQTVTLPFSALNNLPGAGGFDDVQLELLEPSDIRQTLDQTLPDQSDVQQAAEDAIDVKIEDIAQAVTDNIGPIGTPAADAVADAVLDRLDITPGLFGPLSDPLDEVIKQAVTDALDQQGALDVDLTPSLPNDLLAVPQAVDDVQTTLSDIQAALSDLDTEPPDLDIPTLQDIREEVGEELEDVLETLPGGTLLTDPQEFVETQIRDGIDAAVTDQTEQELDQLLQE